MDDALRVRDGEHAGDLHADVGGHVVGQWTVVQDLSQGPAGHELARQVERAVELLQREDRGHARVRQGGRGAGFQPKPFALLGALAQLRVNRLERHAPREQRVVGQVDDAHPAAPDLVVHDVVADEGRRSAPRHRAAAGRPPCCSRRPRTCRPTRRATSPPARAARVCLRTPRRATLVDLRDPGGARRRTPRAPRCWWRAALVGRCLWPVAWRTSVAGSPARSTTWSGQSALPVGSAAASKLLEAGGDRLVGS